MNVTIPRASFAWAPESVRHLFRRANYGLCSHGVRSSLLDGMIWIGTCGTCEAHDSEARFGSLFVLGHPLEVPRKTARQAIPTPSLTALFRSATPISTAVARAALPSAQVELAVSLGVDEWGRVKVHDSYGAIGHVLGMPVCAIAPMLHTVRLLANA